MIDINASYHGENLEDREPKYQVGQLVRHRRYGYRGVIVAIDGHCQADPNWYFNNQTQPDRQQPWYHVLVHGGTATTYPAEENLIPDESPAPIVHPMLDYFFSAYEDGRYVRNDVPWPDL